MSTANPCTPSVLPAYSPLPMRWAQELHSLLSAARRSWRQHADVVAQQRALSGLSDSTLRDIGLAERRLDEPTLGAIDWERGRW